MYKYYATKATNLSEGRAHVFKTNINNITDGGEVINVNITLFNENISIDYVTGSLTSIPTISRRIFQYANWMTASIDNPYVESDQATFDAAYSQSLVFLNSKQ